MARDCPFLYWDDKVAFMGGYACRRTRERILTGSAVYNTYCHNYESSYSQCPNFVPEKKDDGCFLTSACVEAMHLPDDCRELTALRAFRDGWLSAQPGGKAEIEEYYRIAPQIVAHIHAGADCDAVLHSLYERLILPCVEFIDRGQNEEAHALYRRATLELKSRYREG